MQGGNQSGLVGGQGADFVTLTPASATEVHLDSQQALLPLGLARFPKDQPLDDCEAPPKLLERGFQFRERYKRLTNTVVANRKFALPAQIIRFPRGKFFGDVETGSKCLECVRGVALDYQDLAKVPGS